jgi:Glycosyl hydrolase family 26
MYWGGTIKGDTYGMPGEAPTSAAVLGKFETDAGKQITMVNTGQSWGSFNPTTMNAAIAIGAIPLVTMRLEGATLKEVIEGKQDATIRTWANAAKAFGYPFLFRPWWEPNGDWYSWGRNPEYVAAWRHFHDVVEEVGATNVTWAWVVNAIWANPASDPTPYYPGAAYVDWVGMDAYNWGESPLQSDRWLTAEESIEPTLDLLEALAPGKPICICESASTEYGNGGPTESKALWIHEMLDRYLPSRPAIKAYLWFNWNDTKAGTEERFDWPIESSPAAQAAFHEGIQGTTFLSVLPRLTPLAKVPPPAWPASSEADPPSPSGQSPPADATSSPAGAGSGSPQAKPAVAFGTVEPGAHEGTARVSLVVPSAGKLQLYGRGVRIRFLTAPRFARTPVSKWIPSGASIEFEVSTSGPKRQRLAATGSADLLLRAHFAPPAGGALKASTKLTVEVGAD